MNIFVTAYCPRQSAIVLPDKHIVKLPIEMCQMIAHTFMEYNWGTIPKKDGGPYKTNSKSRHNHPCTIWVRQHRANLAWTIEHGLALCHEYSFRYDREHACQEALIRAQTVFHSYYPLISTSEERKKIPNFVVAMPQEIYQKHQIPPKSIYTAYQEYLNTKPWVSSNYLRAPHRKPHWIN